MSAKCSKSKSKASVQVTLGVRRLTYDLLNPPFVGARCGPLSVELGLGECGGGLRPQTGPEPGHGRAPDPVRGHHGQEPQGHGVLVQGQGEGGPASHRRCQSSSNQSTIYPLSASVPLSTTRRDDASV